VKNTKDLNNTFDLIIALNSNKENPNRKAFGLMMGIKNYSDEDLIMTKCFKRLESPENLNCLINITAEFTNETIIL